MLHILRYKCDNFLRRKVEKRIKKRIKKKKKTNNENIELISKHEVGTVMKL